MPKHHFISYSTVDCPDFALKLHEVGRRPSSHPVWLDKRHLEPGRDWDVQLAGAIRDCESLIFVMTPDSVEDHFDLQNRNGRTRSNTRSRSCRSG